MHLLVYIIIPPYSLKIICDSHSNVGSMLLFVSRLCFDKWRSSVEKEKYKKSNMLAKTKQWGLWARPGPAQLANSTVHTDDEVTREAGSGDGEGRGGRRGANHRGGWPTRLHPCSSSRGVEVRSICSPPRSPQLVPFRLPQEQSMMCGCVCIATGGTVLWSNYPTRNSKTQIMNTMIFF